LIFGVFRLSTAAENVKYYYYYYYYYVGAMVLLGVAAERRGRWRYSGEISVRWKQFWKRFLQTIDTSARQVPG